MLDRTLPASLSIDYRCTSVNLECLIVALWVENVNSIFIFPLVFWGVRVEGVVGKGEGGGGSCPAQAKRTGILIESVFVIIVCVF